MGMGQLNRDLENTCLIGRTSKLKNVGLDVGFVVYYDYAFTSMFAVK